MKRSFGKSEKLQFENFGFKGGLTYKLSGKQLLTFNGAHLTKRQRFGIAPNSRLNNSIVDGLQSENINMTQLIFRSPNSKCG
jgi:hypothetical protein